MKKNERKSPYLGDKILRLFLNDEDYYELSGDLEEAFYAKLKTESRGSVMIWYWAQVLKTVPSLLTGSIYWSIIMFNNYLKVAIRNLLKYRGYSFINISGLTIGMASFIFITLFIRYELSYDTFNVNADSIYRIQQGTGETAFAGSPYALPPAIVQEFPEVVNYVRIIKAPRTEKAKISYQNNNFFESNVYAVDASIFEVFTFPLIQGDPATALNDLRSTVISESFAAKCFGSADPVGKTISIGSQSD